MRKILAILFSLIARKSVIDEIENFDDYGIDEVPDFDIYCNRSDTRTNRAFKIGTVLLDIHQNERTVHSRPSSPSSASSGPSAPSSSASCSSVPAASWPTSTAPCLSHGLLCVVHLLAELPRLLLREEERVLQAQHFTGQFVGWRRGRNFEGDILFTRQSTRCGAVVSF